MKTDLSGNENQLSAGRKPRMIAVALIVSMLLAGSLVLVFGATLSAASPAATHISNTTQHYNVWTVSTPTVVSNSTIYANSVVVTNTALLTVTNVSSVFVNLTVTVQDGATLNFTSSTLMFNSSSASTLSVFSGSQLQLYESTVSHTANPAGGLVGNSYNIEANSTSASSPARIDSVLSSITQFNNIIIQFNATGHFYSTTMYSLSSSTSAGPVYNQSVTLVFYKGTGSLVKSMVRDGNLWALYASGVVFSDNVITESANANTSSLGSLLPLVFEYSTDITATGNSISGPLGQGIIPLYTNYSYISNNRIVNEFFGIILYLSHADTLYSNTILNSSISSFGLYPWTYGMNTSYLVNTVSTNNTINGHPIDYVVNGSNLALSNAGYIALVNSHNVTVSGGNLSTNIQSGIIYNSSGVSVTGISQATDEDMSGLGIFNSSSVSISDSNFSDYFSYTGHSTSALSAENVNGLSITNTTVNNVSSPYYAVDAYNTTNLVVGYSNMSNDYYGALSYSSNFNGLTITHSKMTGNYYGGVGYNGITYANNVRLIDSNFSNDNYGGVGYGGLTGQGSIAYTNNLTIMNSVFSNDYWGGIGYQSIAYTNNTLIVNSTFTNDYYGGIGYASSNYAFYYSTNTTIMNSNFSNDYWGGLGFYPLRDTSNLIIASSNFSNDYHGGLGYSSNVHVSGLIITNSTFSNDYYGAVGQGGITDSNNIVIAGSNFSNDYYGAVGQGGLGYSNNIWITSSAFNNDTYGLAGSAGLYDVFNFHIANDKFTNGLYGIDGIGYSSGVYIQGSVFSNDTSGGITSITYSSNVAITGSTFTNDSAGGITSITHSSNVAITGSTFTNDYYGGISAVSYVSGMIVSSSVLSNDYYGGINSIGYSSTIMVANSTLSNDYNGGIASLTVSNLDVANSTLSNDYSGPLVIGSYSFVFINNSMMTGNELGLTIGQGSNALIENSIISGVIYTLSMTYATVVVYNSTVNTNNTQFSGNMFLEAQMTRVLVLDAAGSPLSGVNVAVYSAGSQVFSGTTNSAGYTPFFLAYSYEMSSGFTGVPQTFVYASLAPYVFSNSYTFTVSNVPMTTLTVKAVSGVSRPSAPTNVAAVAGNGFIHVTWLPPSSSGSSSITGYTVTLTWSGGSMSTNVTANILGVNFTSLTNGVTYSVTVSATTSLGTGPASTPVTATPMTAPAAPVLLTVKLSGSQATLTWAAVAGATSYEVLMGTSPSQMSVIATVNSTSYKVTGLNPGNTYYFSIKAVNSAGAGQTSNVMSLSTQASSAQQFADYAPGISLIIIAIASIGAVGAGAYIYLQRRKKKL